MKKLIYIIIVILLFCINNAFSQWEVIYNFNNEADVSSIIKKDSILIVGCYYNNGVLVSSNEGKNWKEYFWNDNIYSIVNKENNVYVLSRNYIYYSSDLGNNWTTINNNFNTSILSIAISGNYLLASVQDSGIYRTSDNGTTWNIVFRDSIVGDYVIAADTNNNVVILDSYLYLSTNNGTDWKLINHGISSVKISINNNIISAINDWDNANISTDKGITWNEKEVFIDYPIYSTRIWNEYIFVSGAGIKISNNYGEKWKSLGPDLYDIFSIFIDSNYIYAGSINSLYRAKTSDILNSLDVSDDNKITTNNYTATLFPNPVQKQTNLQIELKEPSTIKYSIYNSLGKNLLENNNDKLYYGIQTFEINLSQLPIGIYFLKLNINSEIKTLKIILKGE